MKEIRLNRGNSRDRVQRVLARGRVHLGRGPAWNANNARRTISYYLQLENSVRYCLRIRDDTLSNMCAACWEGLAFLFLLRSPHWQLRS